MYVKYSLSKTLSNHSFVFLLNDLVLVCDDDRFYLSDHFRFDFVVLESGLEVVPNYQKMLSFDVHIFVNLD